MNEHLSKVILALSESDVVNEVTKVDPEPIQEPQVEFTWELTVWIVDHCALECSL